MYFFWLAHLELRIPHPEWSVLAAERLIRGGTLTAVAEWLHQFAFTSPQMEKLILEATALHRGNLNLLLSSTAALPPVTEREDLWTAMRHYLRYLAHCRTGRSHSEWDSWEEAQAAFESCGFPQVALLASLERAWDACLKGRPLTCLELIPKQRLYRFPWDDNAIRNSLLARFTCALLMSDYQRARHHLQKLRESDTANDAVGRLAWKRCQLSFLTDFELYDEAIALIDTLPRVQGLASFNEAIILRHKAQIHTALHEKEAAQASVEDFERLRDLIGLKKDFANIFQDKVELLLRSEGFSEAKELIDTEIRLASEGAQHPYRMAFATYFKTKWLLATNDTDAARACWHQSLRIATSQSLSRLLCLLHLLGWCLELRSTQCPTRARPHLFEAISLARASHLPRTQIVVRYLLFITDPELPTELLEGFRNHFGIGAEVAVLCKLARFNPSLCAHALQEQRRARLSGESAFREDILTKTQHLWIPEKKHLLIYEKQGRRLLSLADKPALSQMLNHVLTYTRAGIEELFMACYGHSFEAHRHGPRMHSLIRRLRALLEPHGVRIVHDAQSRRFQIESDFPILILHLESVRLPSPKERTLRTRQKILEIIQARVSMGTGALAKELGLSRQFLFPHLKQLEQEGRIAKHRRGPKTILTII